MAAQSTQARPTTHLKLLEPTTLLLPHYVDAIRHGWSANLSRNTSDEHLADIEADPQGFINNLVDSTEANITLPDGTLVPRLPQITRWLWDGSFCGVITLRHAPGSDALPAYVLGHIGFSVVPWKQNQGYAKEALRQMLAIARSQTGLKRIEITCDADNIASQKVIEAGGGKRVETFTQAHHGPQPKYRYEITL